MSARQVTLLYASGGLVLLLAVSVLSWVELRGLRRIEAETARVQQEVREGQEQLAQDPQAESGNGQEGRLETMLRLLPPGSPDSQRTYETVCGWATELGMAPLRFDAARPERATEGPVAVPGLSVWTRYLGGTGTFWQITALLHRIEHELEFACVHDLAIEVLSAELGKVELSFECGLSVYTRGDPTPLPALSAAQREALVGPTRPLGRQGDDGWSGRGVDWRGSGPLPPRNPFDPYPGLVPLAAAPPREPSSALAALATRLAALERAPALTTAAERELVALEQSVAAHAEEPGLAALRQRLSALRSALDEERATLARHVRDLTQAEEQMASDRPAEAAASLEALATALSAQRARRFPADWDRLRSDVAARRAELVRSLLDQARRQGTQGALEQAQDGADRVAALAARAPGDPVLERLGAEAEALAARVKRLAEIAASLRFAGVVEQGGKRSALVSGKQYGVGARIDVDGERLEVVEIASTQITVMWAELRAVVPKLGR